MCNHLGADFVLRDSVIETDSFMMTLMYCHDADLMEIEQAIAFDQAEYKLSSDKKMLTIKTKTGHEFVFQSETK